MVRKELREHIFKMLFQIEFNDPQEMPEQIEYYFSTLEDAADKDKEYIKRKYAAVLEKTEEIDELIGKLGMKNLSKGVKVDVLEGIVTVSLALNLKYNYSIVEVSARVQEKVKNAIENMTGLEVADVNIKVAGVEMESQE